MSLLIVALPVPPRLSSQQAAGAAQPPAEYDYAFSADGGPRLQSGRATPTALPKAQSVVAAVPASAVGWHRVQLPKAPAAKLRAALGGVLEDLLLEDDAELHLAVAPQARAGEPVWVAAVSKAWLKGQLDALEAGGLAVERVVPVWPPEDAPAGHFFPGPPLPDGGDPGAQLAWRDAEGPLTLPAASDAARALLTRGDRELPLRLTAEPECAAEAMRLAGGNVAALSAHELLYAASRTDWNLRQFDLVPPRRGSRVLREALAHVWNSPAWRPARYGLAGLLLLNLVGANVWAWQQRQVVARQKSAMTTLLQQTFPQVRVVTGAPALQMRKEMDLLRAAAGRAGEGDLEPLLHAADAAWPASRAPADGLRFEPGRLTITSAGWSEQEVEGFRSRLRALGYATEADSGRLTVLPAAGAAPSGAPAAATAATTPPAGTPARPGAGPGAARPVPPMPLPPRPEGAAGGLRPLAPAAPGGRILPPAQSGAAPAGQQGEQGPPPRALPAVEM